MNEHKTMCEVLDRYDNYRDLDEAIIAAIHARRSPIYADTVISKARAIAKIEGCEIFRVVDQRLQRMRKAGVIRWRSKKDAYFDGCQPGWSVCGVEA